MSCKFSIPISGSSSDFLSKAQVAIKGAGGEFFTEGQSGTFQLPVPIGQITGEFVISEAEVSISILQKPLFVSCRMIEQKLREYLSRGS